jgi:hypothetical protein
MNSRRFIANGTPMLQPERRRFFGTGPSDRMSELGHSRRFWHVRLGVKLGNAGCPVLPVEGIGVEVIQASKPEPRIMRYELTDFEWAAIRSLLPNKPRGIPASREHGQTFRRNEIAKTRSASARNCIARGT